METATLCRTDPYLDLCGIASHLQKNSQFLHRAAQTRDTVWMGELLDLMVRQLIHAHQIYIRAEPTGFDPISMGM